MTFEYEMLQDSDLAYMTAKISGMAKDGWRVHTLTTVSVPSDGMNPHYVLSTALLERVVDASDGGR